MAVKLVVSSCQLCVSTKQPAIYLCCKAEYFWSCVYSIPHLQTPQATAHRWSHVRYRANVDSYNCSLKLIGCYMNTDYPIHSFLYWSHKKQKEVYPNNHAYTSHKSIFDVFPSIQPTKSKKEVGAENSS